MIMTYVVKAFNNQTLQTTMCFDDHDEALEAQHTLDDAGLTSVLISEAIEHLGFDDDDPESVS